MFSIKYKIYPTHAQKSSIINQLKIHRELYNHALEQRKNLWENEKRSLSCFDQIKSELPKFKNRGCNYSSLQQTIRRLDKSYQSFFRKNNSYPRFKKSFKSIEFGAYGDGWKFKHDKIYIQNVGLIKFVNHRAVIDPVRLILKFDGMDYWAIVVCDSPLTLPACAEKKIGLDMGMINFITTSDGEIIDHPLPYKKKLKQIQKQQKKKDSSEDTKYKKRIQKRLNKIHKKVKNQRRDFMHKTARKIILENSHIAVENLDIKKMDSFSNINRKRSDLAWGEFLKILQDKAESAGRVFKKVDPSYTSQTCPRCANIHKLDLKERIYECGCGYKEDRDMMAAKNILNKAFAVGLYSVEFNS